MKARDRAHTWACLMALALACSAAADGLTPEQLQAVRNFEDHFAIERPLSADHGTKQKGDYAMFSDEAIVGAVSTGPNPYVKAWTDGSVKTEEADAGASPFLGSEAERSAWAEAKVAGFFDSKFKLAKTVPAVEPMPGGRPPSYTFVFEHVVDGFENAGGTGVMIVVRARDGRLLQFSHSKARSVKSSPSEMTADDAKRLVSLRYKWDVANVSVSGPQLLGSRLFEPEAERGTSVPGYWVGFEGTWAPFDASTGKIGKLEIPAGAKPSQPIQAEPKAQRPAESVIPTAPLIGVGLAAFAAIGYWLLRRRPPAS